VSGAIADRTLLVAVDGPIARITLDRPEKANALTLPMLSALEDALLAIDEDPAVRVVVITGSGSKAFSAGADVVAWSSLEPLEMWRTWTRAGHRVMDRLESLRQPTIAAINGVAYGGGLELALACDLRLAADHVKVAAPEVGIATVPGWGMTTRLAIVVGPARAKQMILTGLPIEAGQAAAWGLVSEVVPAEDLAATTAELAARIAAQAPVAVQVAKQLIDGLRPRSVASLEALGGGLTAFTADAREGQAAFRERRTPVYGGS
jgi:enoyl-CoA hydratase/carnithine racemase